MNYREALLKHVSFQKEIKPQIKFRYEVELELYNTKREAIKEATHHIIPSIEAQGYQAKEIKHIISKAKVRMTFTKNMLSVMSYIYKEDYENSLIAFHKFKESAYLVIEDPNDHTGAIMLDAKLMKEKKFTGEGAYLMVCNDVKTKVKNIEDLIRILGVNNGEVKQVLKANKRMVKRHNKE